MTHYPNDPEFRAGLQAVLADPDNDAPRLVLADWLEERGHCHFAEFIRTQIAIEGAPEKLPSGKPNPEWNRLFALQEYAGLHLGIWPSRHRRGFNERHQTNMAAWLDYNQFLLQNYPLRYVKIEGSVAGYLPTVDSALILDGSMLTVRVAIDHIGTWMAWKEFYFDRGHDVRPFGDMTLKKAMELIWPGITFELVGHEAAPMQPMPQDARPAATEVMPSVLRRPQGGLGFPRER